jgi:hypothetical protein
MHCPGGKPWLRNRLESSAPNFRATLVAGAEILSVLGAHET